MRYSGFADPGLKVAAVVRVLYRKHSDGCNLPLQSTGYKYFDESGREIQFHAFPKLRGTPAATKLGVSASK